MINPNVTERFIEQKNIFQVKFILFIVSFPDPVLQQVYYLNSVTLRKALQKIFPIVQIGPWDSKHEAVSYHCQETCRQDPSKTWNWKVLPAEINLLQWVELAGKEMHTQGVLWIELKQ